MSYRIQETESMTIAEGLIPMPDGVRLYTRYILPKGAKTCPTVLISTP